MNNEKVVSLVLKLIAKTDSGSMKWEPTEEPEVFQLSFPNYSVRVGSRETREGIYYSISLFNSEGTLIDTFIDHELRQEFEQEELHAFPTMKRLYHLARQSAMGIQKALNDILESLGNEDEDNEKGHVDF